MTPPPAEKVAEPFSEIIRFMDLLVESHAKSSDMNHEIALYAACARDVCKRELARLNAAAPAPSGAQSEREAFEAWATPEHLVLDREADGHYTFGATFNAWSAWQARASAGSARVDARAAANQIWEEIDAHIIKNKALGLGAEWPEHISDIIAAHTHSAPPALTDALAMLHDDVADYARINNLGGYDNHAMKAARAALRDAGIHRVECPNCGGDHVFTDCPRKEKGAATNDGPSAATKIAT